MSLFNKIGRITRNKIYGAVDWFKEKLRDLSLFSAKQIVGYGNYSNPFHGHMLLFQYDAKYKMELPYYDTLPLVLPFRVQNDRFWGINLHYVPYDYRIQILDTLSNVVTDSKLDGQRKLAITWDVLKQSAKINVIKPCVKQYLLKPQHVKSRFLVVDSEEWINAVLMPNEAFVRKDPSVGDDIKKFVNFDKEKVWQDSLRRRP